MLWLCHQLIYRTQQTGTESVNSEGKKKRSLKRKIAVSDEEIEKAKKAVVPKYTQVARDWAVGVFKQWLEHHNAVAEKKCPTEILDCVDENLCH